MDGVLDQAAPARLRHVGPPLRGVGALDREVLVVAEDRGHRRTQRPPCTRSRSARNTGALRSTSPHWLGHARTPPRRRPAPWRAARSRSSGFSQNTARPAASACVHRAAVGRRSACRPRRRRSARPPRRRRRRPRRRRLRRRRRTPGRGARAGRGRRRSTRRSRPPSIIALRPSPCAQAMSPDPTKPMRNMPGD